MKKIFAIFMIFTIAISLTTNVLASELPSDWAKEEVQDAIYFNIVPDELQSKYTQKITRAEFAKIAVFYCAAAQNLSLYDFTIIYKEKYESFFGKEYISDNPFTDTDDEYVMDAYALGIIKGRGNGIFDPDSYITRQEAAVMLFNTFISMGGSIADDEKSSILNQIFSDSDKIEEWAKTAVSFVYDINVMNGTSNDIFSPLGNYTREQCYTTFLRLLKNSPYKKTLLPYEEAYNDIFDLDFLTYYVGFDFSNEKYSVYYGSIGGIPHGPQYSLWIIYRSGGKREITRFLPSNNPVRNDIELYDFKINEDESKLIFKRDFNDKTYNYSVDLMTGKLTEN